MKIRNYFVSNSSSSSFVVAFPHKPKSIKDLKEMMFGKQEWHYTGCREEGSPNDCSTQNIAKAVFEDVKKKATKKQILESIENGWFDAYIFPELFPGYYSNDKTIKLNYQKDKEELERLWKEEREINNKRASNIANAFMGSNKDKYIVVLSYGDDGGQFEAVLEHSKIFKRLEHIRTSYH